VKTFKYFSHNLTSTFEKKFKQGRGSMLNNSYTWKHLQENNVRSDINMELNKKSEDFIFIEKCFNDIKQKQDVQGNLSKIERAIQRNFDIHVSISIIDNNTNKFFGMNIFPRESTINHIIDCILQEKPHTDTVVEIWQENKEWFIEIDSILLYDSNLNANPSEITAVLLHEIGHTVYSNSIPQRINKIMRMKIMTLDYSLKQLISNWKVKKIFDLVIVEGCSTKNYHYINTSTERIADNFVVKMGYGTDLDNFIGKLLASQGNSLINRPESDIDTDIKTIVNWSIDNISELEFRKKKLKLSIQTELIKNPSIFVRSIFESIKFSFFSPNVTDNYHAVLTEQYLIDHCKNVLQESILDLFDNIGKVKKIAQSDIDCLGIEVSKIENNDDKIYVLDLIYDKLDLVSTALDYLDKGKTDKVSQSKQTLLGFKKELEGLRTQILNMQLKDKQYGVFIKYPKGYEG
jgi:hypothetical protein